MSIKKIFKILVIIGMTLLVSAIVNLYLEIKRESVVREFKYFTIEDTLVYDDKNYQYALRNKDDDEIVLESVLDYYMIDENELLINTINGYYIFLEKNLVYYEKYDGHKYEKLYAHNYDRHRGEEIISKYVLSSWSKALKKYCSKTALDPEYVPYLKYIQYRKDDRALVDMTYHNRVFFIHNMQLKDDYIYLFNKGSIYLIPLKQHKIYTIESDMLNYEKQDKPLTYNEFIRAIKSPSLFEYLGNNKATIYKVEEIKDIKASPVAGKDIYEFYVESFNKCKY